jgi:ubiquinone/menaquinone biosynthesis C-methylase UbiE
VCLLTSGIFSLSTCEDLNLINKVQQWEQYYRTGALATGPTGPDGSYDLEVKLLWEGFFATLNPAAKILDVGTGNGVIPAIAVETSDRLGLQLEIHATDLADIKPFADVRGADARLRGVNFYPSVATENLPMPNDTFDAVTGHYALEYSDVSKAVAEIYRVLKPGGRAVFVLHHVQSVLVQNARANIEEGEFVISKAAIYQKLKELLGAKDISQAEAAEKGAELQRAVRDVKNLVPQLVREGTGQMPRVALDAVHTLMRMHGQMPQDDLVREIDRAEQELTESVKRLYDLVSVASCNERIDAIRQSFAKRGFTTLETALLHHDRNHLVGWILQLEKPAKTS